MDLTQALEHLEIDLTEINVSNTLTPEYIKKRYHKMALLHHPDKNGDTLRFQLINEAFTFLMAEINLDAGINSNTSYTKDYPFSPYTDFEPEFKTRNIYVNLFYSFIEGILKKNYRSSTNIFSFNNYL